MLRRLRTLTPGLLALCHLGIAQAAQAATPGETTRQTNKAALPLEKRAAKKTSVSPRAGTKAITQNDYARWKTVMDPVLSTDGEWVAYSLTLPTGDSELFVRKTKGAREFRLPRGRVPPPETRSEFLSNVLATSSERPTQFTADSRFLLFTIAPPAADRGCANSNPPMLGIMSLPDGRVAKIPYVSSFTLPTTSTRYVAYWLESSEQGPVLPSSDKRIVSSQVAAASFQQGRTLEVRDLLTGRRIQLLNVTAFRFDTAARYIAYTTSSNTPENNGTFVRRLADGYVTALLTGPGDYRNLVFSGGQIAFLSNRDEYGSPVPRYALYYAESAMTSAHAVVTTDELGGGLRIAPDHGVQFTSARNALQFAVEAIPDDARRITTAGAEVQISRWNDPALWELNGWKQNLFYRAVYHLSVRRWVRLDDEAIARSRVAGSDVLLTPDATRAVAIDRSRYTISWTWGDTRADVYLIDTISGERRLWREAFPAGRTKLYLSPGGKYLLYFKDDRWFGYNFQTGIHADLTGALLPDIRFDVQYYRRQQPRRPRFTVGLAGWTENDKRVLLYSEHDVWEIDPSGAKPPRSLTRERGRRENKILRVWPHSNFDVSAPFHSPPGRDETEDAQFFDLSQPLLLTAHDEESYESGFWLARAGADPKSQLMRKKKLLLLARAKNASYYLLTQQSFEEFPDLWVGERLDRLHKISNANPQQHEYRWGTADVVSYTSNLDASLRGILYKPEDFDASKKYPLLVVAEGTDVGKVLYAYADPHPSDSVPRITSPINYVSKGYLVFAPSPRETYPYPGEYALASLLPGVQYLVEEGFVDASRVALMGFSFGAYRVNYSITRTSFFRCAVSGAGITNTLSAYALPQGPSLTEVGAMLHGSSPWENPWVYVVNSPVIFADRVDTSLLILHDPNDTTVPFEQSLQFFYGLRRHGKEVYLLSYPNGNHGLYSYADRLDADRRVHEYLDHCLRDAPQPEWMRPEWIPAGVSDTKLTVPMIERQSIDHAGQSAERGDFR